VVPGGIVIGSLLVLVFNKIGLGWQVQVAMMLLPTLVYGYLFSKLDFPVTERVSSGVVLLDVQSAFKSLFILCSFACSVLQYRTISGQWMTYC